MTILLADKLSPVCTARLEQAGHSVVSRAGLKGPELVEAVRQENPHVLVVRSTKVPAEVMDAAPNLELIVRAGAGYDTIDVAGASDRGIFVSNCPGKNSAAVAELTMGLILALDRRVPDNVADSRAGVWNKGKYSEALGVKDRVLGVVGLGNIGREVIKRARAFDLDVVAWSRSLTDEAAEELGIHRLATPIDVAHEADIVTLHCAATPDTKLLANAAFFDAMKPGAYFINTTRGSVVDEAALLKAVEEKGIRAAVDVFEGEPAGKDGAIESALVRHPNVYVTHHIGASTEQAQDAIADEAVRIILNYAETGRVPNVVNMAVRTPATHLLTVRHVDKVGVLAATLGVMRRAGWNVQEMENLVFAGNNAACARIRFQGEPREDVLAEIRTCDGVLAANAIRL